MIEINVKEIVGNIIKGKVTCQENLDTKKEGDVSGNLGFIHND